MTPTNENNFLIEVSPKVMGEINQMYMHSETEPVADLHYSPYWKSAKQQIKGDNECTK